jgi:hypothetical protein
MLHHAVLPGPEPLFAIMYFGMGREKRETEGGNMDAPMRSGTVIGCMMIGGLCRLPVKAEGSRRLLE